MNVTQGNLFWNEQEGIIKKYQYLSEDKQCDVLVIGGGIAGALTAFMQAKQGAKVIVVDKNIIGYGATMQTDGTLSSRVDFNVKTTKSMDEKSISKCNILCKTALTDIANIIEEVTKDEECNKYIEKIQFKNVDLLYFSDRITNKIGMYKTFEKIGRINNKIEYLEEDPMLNLRTGIIFPKEAAILNPYILTQVIFMYLNKLKNVEIYENTYINSITSREDGVECISSNRFKIFAKAAVLTSGIHTLEYLKNEDITLNKVFTIVTEPIENLDENIINIVATDVNSTNTTIGFTKDKRIIISGETTKQNERMMNDKYFENFANGKYKKMYMNFRRLINIPTNAKITNCFYGMYLDTKDSLPIIDELNNMPNVYCNLGVGTNGIIFSMIGARMLKDISKRYHVKDMYLFRENREK